MDVQAIVKAKVQHLFAAMEQNPTTSLSTLSSTESNLETDSSLLEDLDAVQGSGILWPSPKEDPHVALQSPTPLSVLCSQCFEKNPRP